MSGEVSLETWCVFHSEHGVSHPTRVIDAELSASYYLAVHF